MAGGGTVVGGLRIRRPAIYHPARHFVRIILPFDIVNAFLEPAAYVWESEFGAILRARHGAGRSQPFREDDLIVKIAVTGGLKGDIYYGFGRQLALATCEKLNGIAVGEINEDTVSMMSEVANMISGKTLADLEIKGYACNISPLEPVGRLFFTLAELADPSRIVYLANDDNWATIWADLAETSLVDAQAAELGALPTEAVD